MILLVLNLSHSRYLISRLNVGMDHGRVAFAMVAGLALKASSKQVNHTTLQPFKNAASSC